jgi:N-acylneuraminate cytidylyltransferase
MNVAVIPARGGSKRIPRKNVRPFLGRPIIAYSIEAARASGLFARVIVSTDDDEIAAVARTHGAEVPFVRPPEVSDDHATTLAVIKHAVTWLRTQQANVDDVCCLYATAPFVRASDLQAGFTALQAASDAQYAFTVTRFSYPIQRALRIDANGRIGMFHPEHSNARSQDLEPAYHDAGQFYWGRAEAFARELPLFSSAAVPIVLPSERVQDIDTIEDWERAELMYRLLAERDRPR